ncbi:MAG: DUF4936 family protein [Betaproteobacteria bacterium]
MNAHDCYVYYRVAPEYAEAARRALAAMQADLEAAGIKGRTFVKAAEPLLWMEVYPAVADPERLIAQLEALAERHGLLRCLADGQRRHVEQFLPMPDF